MCIRDRDRASLDKLQRLTFEPYEVELETARDLFLFTCYTVSYTHLDVYKRQLLEWVKGETQQDFSAIYSIPDPVSGELTVHTGWPEVDVYKRQLKDYVLAQTIDGYASYLSDDFVQASFDFYSTTLSGVKEMHPRWRRCV